MCVLASLSTICLAADYEAGKAPGQACDAAEWHAAGTQSPGSIQRGEKHSLAKPSNVL